MASAFNHDKGENPYTLSLKDTFEGKPVVYHASFHPLNNTGKTTAPIVGGNLCLLAHGIGSNAELQRH